MRLVLDSNVLIAAFVARGICADLLEHAVRVHDPATSQVLLPDHTPDGTEGVLVFDAVSDAVLTHDPIDVGAPPTDLVVARPVSPGETTALRVTAFDPATGRLTLGAIRSARSW